ncbi:isochorismatase domain-containing protein 2-like [Oppia nitens]|uniref:isochorismatase domain-containing protein 2-like n=1 Tax=Oppia nitens TaxID=1686743 RepID=UPI0023DCA596|nr:isochorismatase domain-containing protein 2-like [Oppia nitens]
MSCCGNDDGNKTVGELDTKRTALLVVDLQDKFGPMIQYWSHIIEISRRLVRAAHILDLPIYVSEQKGWGSSASELSLNSYTNINYVSKTQFSMLLPDVLKSMKAKHPSVDTLIVCGVMAHCCVQSTVLTAIKHGYTVHVVVNAVSSPTMTDRKYAIKRMRQSGAFITTFEAAVLGLFRAESDPKFQEFYLSGYLKPIPDNISLLEHKPEK